MSNSENVSSRTLDLSKIPVLLSSATLKDALDKMTLMRLGIALIVDENNRLLGVLTDGDLRRLLLTRQSPLPALLVAPAIDFGNTKPKCVKAETSIKEAKEMMSSQEIWDLPVLSSDGILMGLVHRHSLD
jgi:arabinose-5-phosphate isomerase